MTGRSDADIKALCDNATPGPWEYGDRWHVQGADFCRCDPAVGPLIEERQMRINGTLMLAHVHKAETARWQHGIVAQQAQNGLPVHVVIETDEYGTMVSSDAEFIAAARELVPSLLARAQQAEAERDAFRSLEGVRWIELREAEAELAEARAERDKIFGEALRYKRLRIEEKERADALAVENESLWRAVGRIQAGYDALAAKVQAVEALCDRLEAGNPAQGVSGALVAKAFAAQFRAALAAVSSEPVHNHGTEDGPKKVGRDCQRDGCDKTVSDGPLWRINPKGERGVFVCADHAREAREDGEQQ